MTNNPSPVLFVVATEQFRNQQGINKPGHLDILVGTPALLARGRG